MIATAEHASSAAANVSSSVASIQMSRRHYRIYRAATAWLLKELLHEIERHEDQKFLNLVEAVEEVADLLPHAEAACAHRDAVIQADPLLQKIQTCAHRICSELLSSS